MKRRKTNKQNKRIQVPMEASIMFYVKQIRRSTNIYCKICKNCEIEIRKKTDDYVYYILNKADQIPIKKTKFTFVLKQVFA